jgi:hypothetical protein
VVGEFSADYIFDACGKVVEPVKVSSSQRRATEQAEST